MNTKAYLCASVAVLALHGAPAWAQSGGVALEEIVVTAEHRETNVQATPLNITAIGGDALVAEGIGDARSLMDSVPGMDMSFGTAYTYVGLYGLQSSSGNMYSDGVMTFNYGGIPLARQTAGAAAMYDLERVEVLKGPQGTLYGRNATVGALNVVVNRPTKDFGADMAVNVGNYNAVNVQGAVNIPLSDTLMTRVAFQRAYHEGYYTNGLDDANNYGFRPAVLWAPTDNFSIHLWADIYRNRAKGPFATARYYLSKTQEWIDPGNPWFGLGAPGTCSNQILCPSHASVSVGGVNAHTPVGAQIDTSPGGHGNIAVTGTDNHMDADQNLVAAEMNWTTGIGQLTVLAAHVATKIDFLTSANGSRFKNDTDAKQNSVEARLASIGDTRLKWTIGGFYFTEDHNARQVAYTAVGWGDLWTPNMEDRSYAAFGDVTFSLTERFRLNGGLRYSYEKKTQDGRTTAGGLTPAQQTIFRAAGSTCFTASTTNRVVYDGYVYPSNFCAYPNAGLYEDENVSWKVGVEFDLREQSLLYASAKNGFRAGGFAAGTNNLYKPEKLTAYEIGSKNRFLDGRVQVNASAFYWKYEDQQVAQLQQYFVNGIAAGQTSFPFNVDGDMKGAEVDVQALVTERDRIGFNILRVEGQFDQTPLLVASTGVTKALTNQPRYNLPEWTINATYNHMFEIGRGDLDFGVRAHYESETFLRLIDAPGLTPGDLKDAYVKWDLDLTYRPKEGDWTISAFVKNVSNEAVIGVGSNGQTSVGSWFKPVTNPDAKFASLEAPRTYGVRVTASFGK